MRVLRIGGEYLAARRRQAEIGAWLAGGVGSACVAVATWLLAPVFGVVLALPLVASIVMLLKRHTRLSRGIRGEKLVCDLLRTLSDDYILVNDLTLPGRLGNIDHVVLGPCGVVVIETKYSTLPRVGNGPLGWRIHRQVTKNAIAVREFLTERHPDLRTDTLRFVDSVVVFANPVSRVTLALPYTTVVRYSQLLDVILEKARRRRIPTASSSRLAVSLASVLDPPTSAASESHRQRSTRNFYLGDGAHRSS